MNQYYRLRRQKLSEQGICTQCSKRPATFGFATCEECRTRARNYQRVRHGWTPSPNQRRQKRQYHKLVPRPEKPIICPLCGSISTLFYWHHWDDTKPRMGMWLCPYCNHIVELEDRGLVNNYRELRDRITNEHRLLHEHSKSSLT